MSSAKDQGYFADGIAEELLNALVRVDGLEVASRTSTFAFRGSALSIPDIARTLKVNHILEGSVRTSAERVRITAQLIDVRTDRHVWSEIHDRELTDIFAVQDEIARAIVTALKVEMRVGDDKPLVPRRTTSAEAYDIYLRGVQLLKRRKEATIVEAIELFKEATSIDPQFASAWSNLAVAYVVINIYRVDQDPAVRGLGLEAANRSLAIDPKNSMGLGIRGLIAFLDGDIALALTDLDRSVEFDPKNSSAIVWHAAAFAQTGYLIEARRYQDRAYALEPGYGQNAGWAAVFRHLSGDTAAALEASRQAQLLGHNWGHLVPLQIAFATADYDEVHRQMISAYGINTTAGFAGDMRRALDAITEPGRQETRSPGCWLPTGTNRSAGP